MRKFTTALLSIFMGVCCMFAFTACSCSKTPKTLGEQNLLRSVQMANAAIDNYIDKDLYKLKGDEWELLVNMVYDPFNNEQLGGAATVWDYTGYLGMTNRIMTITSDYSKSTFKKFKKYNEQLIQELAWYRGSATIRSYQSSRRWTAYGVNRADEREKGKIAGKQSVYDDQMWLVREFIAAYNNTGNADYLAEAENLTAYCLDGWDASINPATGKAWGGITWGPGYQTKHTCSNGPIISALVQLSELYKGKSDIVEKEVYCKEAVTDNYEQVTKSQYYLEWAKRVYDWTYNNLKNSDDTFADLIGTDMTTDLATGYKQTTSQGGVDSKRYTYNTGSMISGAAWLYKATGEEAYLEQGNIMAEASYRYFADTKVMEGYVQYPITSATINFNLILLQGYFDLAPFDSSVDLYIKGFQDSLDYAYDHFYLNGALPRDLLNGWLPGYKFDSEKKAMDSAAYAEMYGILYEYEQLKAERDAK